VVLPSSDMVRCRQSSSQLWKWGRKHWGHRVLLSSQMIRKTWPEDTFLGPQALTVHPGQVDRILPQLSYRLLNVSVLLFQPLLLGRGWNIE
jgi:hypothetical protein